ncbi:MAG: hypothetical protein QOF51_2112 [Chloroflexota bacterium]|jgi:plastocyanin|nr:hypothetical protein [Chloroflexota bacterium]
MKDTLLIDPGDAYDLLFTADQAGDFPFHDHFEAANTNNGVWLGGMHTMVHIGEPHDHASPAVSGPAPGPASDSSRVFIRDNFYTPNFLTVPLGTTVTWEHQGKAQHTVSSLAGYFDSGTLNGGDTFTYTFTEPGQYNYFCRFHITNRGIIIVQ